MAIYLITGKPGHGKTLYAVTKIQQRAKEENRHVYYDGIKDLKLPWEQLEDATQWHNPEVVPDGAIIVIDECQRTFPPRATGSKVPPHVQPFDTHRHRGLDIYLITQDPMLIDSFVRNLVGEHRHILRSFGAQSARVFHWDCVRDPDSRAERAASQQTDVFFYPKESFELYHSASHHTVKRRLPRVITVALPLVLVLIFGSAIFAFQRYKQRMAGADKKEVATQSAKSDTQRPALSEDWRITGYIKKGEKVVVILSGADGKKRYSAFPKELMPDPLNMAFMVDGAMVTRYSGNFDRVEDSKSDHEKPKVGKS